MIHKIAIVGPESTGKSTLAEALADYFKTTWVKEYAREFLEEMERPYTQSDLLEIALGQLQREKEAQVQTQTQNILICDTNLLVVKIWSQYKFGKVDPVILDLMDLESYSHHFLCDIDTPWVFDPQREHPHNRQELLAIYHNELQLAKIPYTILIGTRKERLEQAHQKINHTLFAK